MHQVTYIDMKQEVYSMLNESVIKLLKNGMWDLATCAISVYDAQSLEGYQIKGNAEYVTEGTITIINPKTLRK